MQYAYDQGFSRRRQGYAAAIGVIIYVIVLVPFLITLGVAVARSLDSKSGTPSWYCTRS